MNEFEQRYTEATRPLASMQLPLQSLIQTLLETEGIRVHGVSSRVKSRASVLGKLERSQGQRTLESFTDLLGVRIITYFPDEVDAVATLIEREFDVDTANSVDKRATLSPDSFGYLSLHYILRINDTRTDLPEWGGYSNVSFELQIRSILQHAWAEIEHDLQYKASSLIADATKRRFFRLAGLLELADAEFADIRTQLTGQRSAVDEAESLVERLLSQPVALSLPAWQAGITEELYNRFAASVAEGFTLLDRQLIPIPSGDRSGRLGRFEPCDLLGPANELVHVSRPRSSASYGHLFNQALVSTEILIRYGEARASLAQLVAQQSPGRHLVS